MKFKRKFKLISLFIILIIGLLVSLQLDKEQVPSENVLTEQETVKQWYDSEVILPSAKNVLVLTAPYLTENTTNSYLFDEEDVSMINNLTYIDFVYPTFLSYSPFLSGINVQNSDYLLEQYETTGTFYKDYVYDTEIELSQISPDTYLDSDQLKVAESENMLWIANEGASGSIISPNYPFAILKETSLGKDYNLNYILGDLPIDDSNQILISDKLAYTYCEKIGCSTIDELIGQMYTIALNSNEYDVNSSKTSMTGEISGIYFGNRGYNNVITSYDTSLADLDFLTENLVESYTTQSSLEDCDNKTCPVSLYESEPKVDTIVRNEVNAEVENKYKSQLLGIYGEIIVVLDSEDDVSSFIESALNYDSSIGIKQYEKE